MAVNSVTEKQIDLLGTPVEGYLALNGCTNFGGHTFVSIPSSSCSSEATGIASGIVGLAESHAREVGIAAHPGLTAAPGTNVLSANEVMQLVRASADDIDFSTPNVVDPANNFGTPSGNPLIDTVRYPTRAGWDTIDGYGRVNAYELMRAIDEKRIPPEAMIDGPAWFSVLPARGHRARHGIGGRAAGRLVRLPGRVGAGRATTGVSGERLVDHDRRADGAHERALGHARDARPRGGRRGPARTGPSARRSIRAMRTDPTRSGSRFACGSSSPHTAGPVTVPPARCRSRSSSTTTPTSWPASRLASLGSERRARFSSTSTATVVTRWSSAPTTATCTRIDRI